MNLILIILDGHYCSSALRLAEAGSMHYTCHQNDFECWTLNCFDMALFQCQVMKFDFILMNNVFGAQFG